MHSARVLQMECSFQLHMTCDTFVTPSGDKWASKKICHLPIQAKTSAVLHWSIAQLNQRSSHAISSRHACHARACLVVERSFSHDHANLRGICLRNELGRTEAARIVILHDTSCVLWGALLCRRALTSASPCMLAAAHACNAQHCASHNAGQALNHHSIGFCAWRCMQG